jgi:uncharacterized protein YkwD
MDERLSPPARGSTASRARPNTGDMRVRRAAIAAVVVLGVTAPGAQACPGTHAKLKAGNAAKVAKATVCLLNKRRARAGLRRLTANKKLRAAATAHSQDMVDRGYFEHDGPEGDTLFTRAERVGYLTDSVSSWALAENIAYGSGSRGTAAGIVKAWMGSSVHRANILTPSIRDAGVGLASGMPDGGSGATYTLDLGFARG